MPWFLRLVRKPFSEGRVDGVSVEQTGHFQVVLWQVAQFLMALAFVMVLILSSQVLGPSESSVPDVIDCALSCL